MKKQTYKSKTLVTFHIPVEYYEYLWDISQSKHYTMTRYILNLLDQDKQNQEKENARP